MPSTIEEAPIAARAARLKELAGDGEVEWIVIVDADAVLAADAFGALRRAAGAQTAMVGGRALVGAAQRLGAMFGPARSGPNPFDLVALIGPQSDRHLTELVRGPIDVPQRGAFVVSAAFVRSLADVALDAITLHLDLAVHARRAGLEVICEPSLVFNAEDDPLELRRALGNLRRFTGLGSWQPQGLHRDPARLRSAFITREVRVGGSVRGYHRRPYPPVDVFIVAADEIGRAGAQREGAGLATGTVTTCAPADGDVLRRVLTRTSDRYLLVADAGALPNRAALETLVERVERSAHVAVALERAEPPYGAALLHCGRIVNAAAFAGATVQDVLLGMIEQLPEQRLFAATPAGEIVPARLPPLAGMQHLDAVFVAAAKPTVTHQTLQALMAESVKGTLTVVYPAGASTTERVFAVHSGLRLLSDDSDPQLAIGLNRALGACTSDAIAIVRDDAQLPRGCLERLKDAFRRIPRLGVAVPRVGGADRPESLPDLGYRSSAEMQALYDRRAEAFAREANLRDFATAPVMVVSREALEVVGGFDELFGFSRPGVEDFTRRIRAANFLVACCEDAYVHLFPKLDAASFIGNLDDAPFLRDAYEKRWSNAQGFDPQTDRVPLRADATPRVPARAGRGVRILLLLRDQDEWLQARPLVIELATAFRVGDPVEVAIGLDGTLDVQTALSALREVLLASTVAMDETLTISIEVVSDVTVWRDAGENNVRIAGQEREELVELPIIDGAGAVRALFSVPTA